MRTPYKYNTKRKIVGLHDKLKPRKYNVFMVGSIYGERHLVATCDTLDDARRKRDVARGLKTTAKDFIIVGSGCMSVIDRG